MDNNNNNNKPKILMSVYDISTGQTPEGYIAFKVLEYLSKDYDVSIITRCNNLIYKDSLPNVNFIGFDLPNLFLKLKKKFRLHSLYSYLWHLLWPLFPIRNRKAIKNAKIIHHFNFHNDSLPSLSWIFNKKIIWGPINHHEIIPKWRYKDKKRLLFLSRAKFSLRVIMWKFDPFLYIFKSKVCHFITAGDWVNKRLSINQRYTTLSQLGIDESTFFRNKETPNDSLLFRNDDKVNLLSVGRAVLIKGHMIAIDVIKVLPDKYTLTIVASGPDIVELLKYTSENNLNHRVKFVDNCTRAELNILFNTCQMFLFMSAEVAGLVWLEALASGSKVITFQGNTEIVRASKIYSNITVVDDDNNYCTNVENLKQAILDINLDFKSEEDLSPYYFASIANEISKIYKLNL